MALKTILNAPNVMFVGDEASRDTDIITMENCWVVLGRDRFIDVVKDVDTSDGTNIIDRFFVGDVVVRIVPVVAEMVRDDVGGKYESP